MSKSHAYVVSLDENVPHQSNLLKGNELFSMNETAIGNKTNIGTNDGITRNQRTYVTIQDNKHRLKDLRTDSSFTYEHEWKRTSIETVKKTRSKSKSTCRSTCRDREPLRLRCNKIIKMFKKSRLSTKRILKHQISYNTPHSSAKENFLYALISEFTLPLDCVEVDLWEKNPVQFPVV